MNQASLLVELLTEELPPKSLAALGKAFSTELTRGLSDARLIASNSKTHFFATPRRIAALITEVLDQAPDRTEIEKIMPVSVALDPSGNPTAALKKKLAAKKIPEREIQFFTKRMDGKTETFFYEMNVIGYQLSVTLPIAVETALKRLPISKVMRWGSGEAQFVRPVHGLVMMHGSKVIPGKVFGLESSNRTRGHRFLGAKEIVLESADEYERRLLADGRVLADFGKRRAEIESQLQAEAKKQGASLGEHQALLDEVAALVEFPSVYVGEFDKAFLAVPQECLILTMRQNQKYFPLFDAGGRLTGRFLIVSNMRVTDPRNIIDGNQRVVRPRLEDARFFFDQDRRQRLEERVPQLARVVYHRKLGSQLERVERLQLLAGRIARELKADAALAERAGWLAKADLLTGMVGEFPELQG
ncbi:MAG: glycine--tRNA ligase subunit beta, partial [Pseudomonadota bacterium]